MVALIVSLKPPGDDFTFWQIVFITVFFGASLVALTFDVHDYLTSRRRRLRGERRIRDYMYQWVENGSRAAIFSRDLSWVADDKMNRMLENKARSNDLVVVMPKANDKSHALQEAGAKILYYGDGYLMKSRFTIINLGRTDVAVAVGTTRGEIHYVEEFEASQLEPAFWMAQDLMELINVFCTKQGIK
jgi:hypothetical protein